MNTITRNLFRAIHEGKWLSIEYKNKNGEVTKYWIGVEDICMADRSLHVSGLHLAKYTLGDFPRIYIDSILSAGVIEGSWHPINQKLVDDIRLHPETYKDLFEHPANFKILNYLADCSRLDTTPYQKDYALIPGLDGEQVESGVYHLKSEQYRDIIRRFQYRRTREKEKKTKKLHQLCMNLLSIPTSRGMYVLAYRKMNFDVRRRRLVADEEVTICREFTLDGELQSIRRFLPEEYEELLEDFERNQEEIKDRITQNNPQIKGVDDRPYLLTVTREILLDLNEEYEGIMEMYRQ